MSSNLTSSAEQLFIGMIRVPKMLLHSNTSYMSIQPKKLIGSGLQFNVYTSGKGPVLKIPTNRSQKKLLLMKWGEKNPKKIREQMLKAERVANNSLHVLKKIIKSVDPKIIGNPIFLRHPSYEQDRVIPLGAYLTKHSLSDNKTLLKKYTESIIQTWRFGFGDTVFNFTINNGIKNGRVILVDLGELTFSKKEISGLIAKKIWLKRWSYLNLNDSKLKKHFATLMNLYITTSTLEKNWKTNLR